MLWSARTLRTWIASGCVGWLLAFAPTASFATGAEPSAATQAQKSDAQKRFDRGRELAQANRNADALVEFKASYEIVASPNTHFSMARTLANLGQRAEAYTEFGKTLIEAQAAAPKDKRYLQTAEACETEQRELRTKLAFLAIVVDHGDAATVKIGERELDRRAIAGLVPVSPGPVIVTVSNGGAEVARQALTLGAGDQKTITFDAQPKTPDVVPVVTDSTPQEQPVVSVDTSPGGLRTAAYVAGGVGIVGLATFAIFGALEKSKYNDLQDACHGGPCPPERSDDISAGRSRQTIANVGLGVGLAGAVAGAVLFVVSAPSKTSASTTASIVVSPGFVGVGGTL